MEGAKETKQLDFIGTIAVGKKYLQVTNLMIQKHVLRFMPVPVQMWGSFLTVVQESQSKHAVNIRPLKPQWQASVVDPC